MKMRKYLYSDPTGGGEDATLEIPEWAEPPGCLTMRLATDSQRLEFTLDEEIDNEN